MVNRTLVFQMDEAIAPLLRVQGVRKYVLMSQRYLRTKNIRMGLNDPRRLRQLEEENRRAEQLLA